MPYALVSVPKKTSNEGRPTGKSAYLLVFKWDDVAIYTRDDKGVRVTAFAFAEGKKPVGIYHVSTSGNVYHSSTGEEDGRGFIHNADFEIPGTAIEVDEFFENNINERLGVISIPCAGGDAKIAGTPCNPLFITQDNQEDSSKKNGHSVQMKSSLPGSVLGHIIKSLVPLTDDLTINAILKLTGTGSDGLGI